MLLIEFILSARSGYVYRITVRKTPRAVLDVRSLFDRSQLFNVEIYEAVRAYLFTYLVYAVFVSNQIFLAVDVRSEIAGRYEGRRADTHMHFFRTRVAQRSDYLRTRSASDDLIVNKYHSLDFYRRAQTI